MLNLGGLVTKRPKVSSGRMRTQMGGFSRQRHARQRRHHRTNGERTRMDAVWRKRLHGVGNDTKKAQGGKRVMYTSHHPAWDAKSRIALPEILDLDYKTIAHVFENVTPVQKPIDKLLSLMNEDGISSDEVQRIVEEKGHYPAEVPLDEYPDKFITGWLIKYWPQIKNIITANRTSNNE